MKPRADLSSWFQKEAFRTNIWASRNAEIAENPDKMGFPECSTCPVYTQTCTESPPASVETTPLIWMEWIMQFSGSDQTPPHIFYRNGSLKTETRTFCTFNHQLHLFFVPRFQSRAASRPLTHKVPNRDCSGPTPGTRTQSSREGRTGPITLGWNDQTIFQLLKGSQSILTD